MKRNNRQKNIASVIIRRFNIRNLIAFSLFLAVYLTVFLFCFFNSPVYEVVKDITYQILDIFFSDDASAFILSHSYIIYLIFCGWFFVFNFTVTSVSTLINFNRTYKSLDAFTDSEKEISVFPKRYSDVEIRLKDIKLDILEKQNQLTDAENKRNDLVMYLAHDLKTPLTSVIGYLTLLQESPELTVLQRAKFTDIALDKAYRLEQLITEFFEITRFNIHSVTLERNRIDLKMMIYQIVDEFYPMLSEKNLTVDIDIPDDIIMFADSDKIARVFDNLLKNAVNYSYENSMIRIGARVKNSRAVIKFRNKCDEIPAEKLTRLFDKFYRTDSSRSTATGGSGLGLAIAKQITELHSGTIKASSNTDYTDFTVILPYIDASDISDEQLEF